MPISPDLLRDIRAHLASAFDNHRLITITPIKGDPPEQYELLYRLSFLQKSDNNTISPAKDPVIILTIPFGFPHFPPSCKPKSSIYHPDFDPAAICLGDFWHPKRSLVELIIHVGKLLNCETFSIENAFNEEAAIWYREHSGDFPLSDLSWTISGNGEVPPAISDSDDIDTLRQEDLDSGFDFSNFPEDINELEIDAGENDTSKQDDFDLSHFYLLERQHNYFQLKKALSKKDEKDGPLIELLNSANEAIQKAKKLHNQAKDFEQDGDAQNALRVYNQVVYQVADYPGITSDIRRMRQAQELLLQVEDNVSAQSPGKKPSDIPSQDLPPETVLSAPEAPANKSIVKKREGSNARELSAKSSKRTVFLLMVLSSLALCLGTGAYIYMRLLSEANHAEVYLKQCETKLSQSLFSEAEHFCKKVTENTALMAFIQPNKRKDLRDKAQKILQSDALRQGIEGKILFQGEYLPRDEVQLLGEIEKRFNSATTLFASENWQDAAEELLTLNGLIQKSTRVSEAQRTEIATKLQFAQFQSLLAQARTYLSDRKYLEAQNALEKCQELLDNLPVSERDKYSAELSHSLMAIQFEAHKTDAELFFSQADWQKAIKAYDQALKAATQSQEKSSGTDDIELKMKRAMLYATVEQGNTAFAQGSWNDAASSFRRAMLFIQQNKNIFNPIDFDHSINKLAKITLQTVILSNREEIKSELSKSNLTGARARYQKMISAIDQSQLAAEPEFVTMRKEFLEEVNKLETEIYLQDKIDYLKNNYLKIFLANFSSAEKENLSSPVITLHNETKDALIFRMQCTERSAGMPLALVMFYLFDKKTEQWRPHFER